MEKQETAENLKKYFKNIGPNFASKIPNQQEGFENYLANCNTIMNVETHIFPWRLVKAQATMISLSMQYNVFDFVVNYSSISFLRCFSKLLERIMYNRLYLYLTENDLFYNKQLSFNIPLIMLLFNWQIKYATCLTKTFTH